jgi:4-amino-4-deoxy-L-arabinose transferase-like glycosyltransferase
VMRLVGLSLIPLTDETEARYGEIARKMLETGNWVTPLYTYTEPFWAKPPLSTWLSAAGMGVFGVNEFGARISSLLLAIAAGALIFQWVARRSGRDQALLSTVILASSAAYFVAAGTVMTDPSLLFATTLAMIAYWNAMQGRNSIWGYLFFTALGVGLLAKGPIVIVLSGLPIGLWALARGQLMKTWRNLPWITGTLLMLVVAVPWYGLAEHRTPGFLNYFLIGEHFRRYTESGWQGDLYGRSRGVPLGTIWLYWLGAALPWSPLALIGLLRLGSPFRWLIDSDGWRSYLLLWSTMTLVFFSIARNVIWPYVLPALPPFAVLLGEMWGVQPAAGLPFTSRWTWLGALVPIAVVAALLVLFYKPARLSGLTQKPLALRYLALRESPDSQLLYLTERFYSAEFYTAGKAVTTKDPATVQALLHNHSRDFIAITRRSADLVLRADIQGQFEPVGVFGGVQLLEEARPAK